MDDPATSSDNVYRLIGSEESPYSVKVRSYLRYKALPHRWLNRTEAGGLFQEHARLPLVPLLVTPEGEGLQDSTPIIETLESRHPVPAVHPEDPVCAFLSCLLEEFADEWGNKWMFHYRWAREQDQKACARRLAALTVDDGNEAAIERAAAAIRERMVSRVWFVGSSPQTARQIEESFKDSVALLDAHLGARAYLFGERPAFADFALWGQLYNAHRDPTPRELLTTRAPHVVAWIERMQEPAGMGDFEGWNSLRRTLGPLLEDQVAGLFLPWSQANARAIAEDQDTFSVTLMSGDWQQRPQKYHARSLAALKERYRRTAGNAELDGVLASSGCLPFLTD